MYFHIHLPLIIRSAVRIFSWFRDQCYLFISLKTTSKRSTITVCISQSLYNLDLLPYQILATIDNVNIMEWFRCIYRLLPHISIYLSLATMLIQSQEGVCSNLWWFMERKNISGNHLILLEFFRQWSCFFIIQMAPDNLPGPVFLLTSNFLDLFFFSDTLIGRLYLMMMVFGGSGKWNAYLGIGRTF